MKKKIASMFLALVLLTLPVVGCQAQSTAQVATTAESTSTATTQTSTASSQSTSNYFSETDTKVDYDESTASKIVFSSSTAKITGDGAVLEGKTVKITKAGTYILSGSSSEMNLVVEVADTEKVWLVLDNLTMKGSTAPIQALTGDKVVITLAKGSTNSIEDLATPTNQELDAAIYSKIDITINGYGKLTVNGKYEHAIKSSDDLKVIGGTLTLTAANDGLNANDALNIKDSTIEISAKGDGIHSDTNVYIDGKNINIKESEEGIEGKVVDIVSGDIYIKSTDDGINATDSSQTTTAANVTVQTPNTTTSNTTSSQNTDATSSATTQGKGFDKRMKDGQVPPEGFGKMPENFEDLPADVQEKIKNRPARPEQGTLPDGQMPNAGAMPNQGKTQSQDGTEIIIRGGYVYVDAGGDGIDSNGNLTVSGGKVVVEGSENGGNGALDYDGTGSVTGGEVLALGQSDMLQSFSTSSSQSHIVATTNSVMPAGTKVTIKDGSGKVLYEYTAKKAFSAAIYSSKDIVKANNYTVQIGDNVIQAVGK